MNYLGSRQHDQYGSTRLQNVIHITSLRMATKCVAIVNIHDEIRGLPLRWCRASIAVMTRVVQRFGNKLVPRVVAPIDS